MTAQLQTSHEARAAGAYHRTLRQIPARRIFVVRGQLQKAVFDRRERESSGFGFEAAADAVAALCLCLCFERSDFLLLPTYSYGRSSEQLLRTRDELEN
jgi:hypothetical protein